MGPLKFAAQNEAGSSRLRIRLQRRSEVGLAPGVADNFEVALHHFGKPTDEWGKFVYSEGSRLLDVLGPRKEFSDRIKAFGNWVFDSDQTRGIEAHEVLQLSLDLVSSAQDTTLFLAKQVPSGPGFRESLQGVLVAHVFQFAPQPFQFLCKLKKSRLSHIRTF